MNYFYHMLKVLRLDRDIYRALAVTNLPIRYCMINVTVLGLIYGISSIHFAKILMAKGGTAAVAFSPLMVMLVGISIAFLMHGGAALFVWVFCRGMGGCPHFMPPYLNIGICAISLWPLAPVVSGFQAGASGPVLTGFAVLAIAYAACVMYVAVQSVSALSNLKMGIAAVGTIIYVGCFLYLWM